MAQKAISELNVERLSTLFNYFRLAHLNRKEYSKRLTTLKRLDKALSILVMVATAASFAVLAFAFGDDKIPHSTMIGALLSIVAFLTSVAIPILGLSGKIEDLSNRACAFHYAAQQLESAIRFIKATEDVDGVVLGWFSAAESAYLQAAALPDTEAEDRKLIEKVENEVNQSYPADYVWSAL
jgi:ABC-type multidrug transport system fused ATPase/permease subunit